MIMGLMGLIKTKGGISVLYYDFKMGWDVVFMIPLSPSGTPPKLGGELVTDAGCGLRGWSWRVEVGTLFYDTPIPFGDSP
jgi:hypothetical protein